MSRPYSDLFHVTPHLQTLFQFILSHPPSADPISVYLPSPSISIAHFSSFYLIPHHQTLKQFVIITYLRSRHISPHHQTPFQFISQPPLSADTIIFVSRPFFVDYPITPHQQTLFQIISCHHSSAYPISVHFTSTPFIRPQNSSSSDPIPVQFMPPPISRTYFISFQVTPHQHILKQSISHHHIHRADYSFHHPINQLQQSISRLQQSLFCIL